MVTGIVREKENGGKKRKYISLPENVNKKDDLDKLEVGSIVSIGEMLRMT